MYTCPHMIQEKITYAQRVKMIKQIMFKILAVHKGHVDVSILMSYSCS